MKFTKTFLAGLSALTLAACVPPPANPAEAAARKAAGAEYAARNCGAFVGGFQDARALKDVADEQITLARNLGADDAMIAKARSDVEVSVSTAAAFTTIRDACGQLVSSLAWET